MRSAHLLFAGVLGTAALSPAQLAGTYIVGPAGNYANVAAAIAALTSSGVVAPVTFVVTANDSGPWTIPGFPGQGPANPVSFEASGPITISGTQPVLTLNGCANVTIRGFNGTFTATPSAFVVNGGASDCVFTACDFQANLASTGAPLFQLVAGNGTRIEDSTFGGAFEALRSEVGDTNTTVERCRITGGGWRILTIGGTNFTLVNNFITGSTNYGINGGIPGTPSSGANMKIWHNTVYIVHTGSGTQLCTLRWYSSAPGTEVVDNIFYDELPSATAGFNLWCSGALRPTVMDYNCLWSNQPSYFPVFASGNQSLAAWQGLGFDVYSFQADPQFTAPTSVPPDLTLQPTSPCATTGTTLPTVFTDFFFMPRSTPVSIGAHEEGATGVATYTVFGTGCAGSAGVPSNSASQPPRLGQTSLISFGNLPAPQVAIGVLGLSNTFAGAIPLPVDLGILGAPGCNVRVSLDATLTLFGVGGVAGFNFSIPYQISLLGFPFFTQALVLDPPLNALGLSTSDAAAGVIGF